MYVLNQEKVDISALICAEEINLRELHDAQRSEHAFYYFLSYIFHRIAWKLSLLITTNSPRRSPTWHRQ